MATLAINLGVQAAGLLGGLLAQHTVRLKDAQNENEAVANVIPTFDADMKGAADAYNSGEASQSQVLDFLAQVDGSIKSYLQKQVGKPGTAWTTSASGVCDKSCTVGCCIFNTFLHPAIVRLEQVISQGSGKMTVPGIPTNKYNFPARASYPLVITKPSALLSSPTGAINSVAAAFSNLLGASNTDSSTGPAAGSLALVGSAGGGSSSKTNPLLIVGLILLAVVAMFELARR